MRTAWRQHPGAAWFAVLLSAAIVLIAVFARADVFHKTKTPPQAANLSLRIGPGTAPTRPSRPIRAGATASAIATADYSTCAVVAGGVDCWGDGAHGQLGSGGKENSLVPVAVEGLPGTVVSLAAGGSHACAALADGSVVCWGDGTHGELGDGTRTDALAPVLVRGIQTAIAVAAGVAHTCALLRGGSVECWGANANGQLGNDTTRSSAIPVPVVGISGATEITAGLAHTCALRADGTVSCWGANANGELGDGKALDSPTPVAVTGLTGATAVSAGDAHTCALLQSGSVDCWGWNIEGQLGNGADDSAAPVPVAGLPRATAISAGGDHTCVLVRSGSVDCWGANLYGQLGNGTTTDSSSPVSVLGLGSGVTALSAGLYKTCALLRGGSATCWGANANGQLGNGTRTASTSPVNVAGLGLAPDGSGSVSASPNALPSSTKHTTISFTYTTPAGGIHDGALAIVVPYGWSLPSTTGGDPGFTTASAGRLIVAARTISVTGLTLARGQTVSVNYGSTAEGGPGALVIGSGSATWKAREQSSPGGALSPLTTSPRIAVLAPDGSGALATPTQTVPNGARRTLRFTYIADKGGASGGTLALRVPPGWSLPSAAPSAPGFVITSTGTLAIVGRTISISRLNLSYRDKVTITYRDAKAPAANVGSQTWTAEERSGSSGRARRIAVPPSITVLSANGSGQVQATATAIPNGSHGIELTFRYTADAGGLKHGAVDLTVPPGWSAPSTNSHAAGFVETSTGRVRVAGRRVVVLVDELSVGATIYVRYGSRSRGGPGASAPGGAGGPQTWIVQERSASGGTLTDISIDPKITILSPDGSGVLSRATGPIAAGSQAASVVFVFAAGSGGMADGQLELFVPAGWSPPSVDPSAPGYVTASPGTLRTSGRAIILSGLFLPPNGTATVVYGNRSSGGPGATTTTAGPTIWNFFEQSSSNGTLRPVKKR